MSGRVVSDIQTRVICRHFVVVRVIHLCIYLSCRITLAFNMLKRKDALFVWLAIMKISSKSERAGHMNNIF